MGYLFDDLTAEPASPLYWVIGAAFLLLLIAALYLYLQAPRALPEDGLRRRLARRYARLVAGFSGLGLAATLFALLTVPFLSKRLWLGLALLGLLGTLAHAIWYFRRRYHAARHAYDESARRRRSLPRPRSGGRKRRHR